MGLEPANRRQLATNLVSFAKEYDVGGIDIDWKYPSAPEIADIPNDSAVEGENYHRLVALLRILLPDGKSPLTAVPALH